MTTRKPTSKQFFLHKGDKVTFHPARDRRVTMKGTLMFVPYGRRLWGAVRNEEDGVIHVLPSRDYITGVIEAV